MHATGVLGHVAANAASNLAAGVGGVVQAVLRRGLADGQVAHTALDDRRAGQRIDADDASQSGQRQGDPSGMGQGAS